MSDEAPALRLSYWGRPGAAIDQALTHELTEHARACHREQRRRDDAEAIGSLVRDAILAGEVSQAAVMSLLVAAPPPVPSLRQHIAATLRQWAGALIPSSLRKGAPHG